LFPGLPEIENGRIWTSPDIKMLKTSQDGKLWLFPSIAASKSLGLPIFPHAPGASTARDATYASSGTVPRWICSMGQLTWGTALIPSRDRTMGV